MDRRAADVRREVPVVYAPQRFAGSGDGVTRAGPGGAAVRVSGGYADPTAGAYAVPPPARDHRAGQLSETEVSTS